MTGLHGAISSTKVSIPSFVLSSSSIMSLSRSSLTSLLSDSTQSLLSKTRKERRRVDMFVPSRHSLARFSLLSGICLYHFLLTIAFIILLQSVLSVSAAGVDNRKLQARHSFAPPFQRQIPNWNVGAGGYLNQTYCRLTPAKQSRTGFVWNSVPCILSDWEIEVEFQITGLRNLGGDGFAIWYTERSEMLGAVYGSTDYWTGLGIVFDTFNNDNIGSSPLISVLYNDGTQRFDAHSDGASQALATCSFDFRNLPTPSVAKIKYEKSTLTLEIALSRSNEGVPYYQPCVSVQNLELGVDKYFGVTAHTGDVADNHDVISFSTFDLSPSDVDLSNIRAHYQQTLEQQHQSPTHGEMSPSEFQHTVLTLLNQMQEEVNLIQMSELAISEFLFNGEPMTMGAGIRPGGIEPPQAKLGGPGETLTQLQRLAEDQIMKVNSISDTQSNLMREIRSLQSSIQFGLNQGGFAGAGAGAGAGGAGGAAGSNIPGRPLPLVNTKPLSEQIAGSSVTSADIEKVNGNIRGVSDVIAGISRRIDDVMNQVNRVKDEQTKMNGNILTTSAQLSTSMNSGLGSSGSNNSGGFGWIPYLMLMFSTFCIASLTYHTFTQHMKNQRYKMI